MTKTKANVGQCAIDGCPRIGNAGRGWCWTHYSRWRSSGDPLKLGPRGERATYIADPVERFWSKIHKTDSCWFWIGHRRRRGGYGSFYFNGVVWAAHRYSYTFLRGPIPDGLVLDHLCGEPSCVNPDHLETVTLAENSRRAKKLRPTCGQGHEMAGDNVVTRKDGARYCRACFNASQRGRRNKYRAERDLLAALASLPFDYTSDEPAVNDLLGAVNRLLDVRFKDSEWNPQAP
jgi:hypothetical protein